jgi:transposase-like protein
MRQSRRHFSASQEAQIVGRDIRGKEPISNLADEFGFQPSQIHTWVKHVLDQAERALERSAGRVPRAQRLQVKSTSTTARKARALARQPETRVCTASGDVFVR